jgi:stage II sporulation protein E
MVSAQLEGISNIISKLSTNSNIGNNQKLIIENIEDKMRENELDIYDIKSNPINNSDKINIYIEMEPCSGNNPCQNQIIKLLSREFKSNFRLIKSECGNKLKDNPCGLLYGQQGDLSLEVTTRQLRQKNVSGDTYLYKQLGNGKDMIVLSDGMGVGVNAARESNAAVNLLERIIKAGFDQELAIEIINSALFLRNNDENFTTLDIMFFDTFSGKVIFNKIGSASSFIKRDWKVEQIKPDSLPIGILEHVEITENTKELEKDDFVIMFSDGVFDAIETDLDKEEWFKRLLQNSSFDLPGQLADYILDTVRKKGNINDDITIIVFKVKENNKKSRKFDV